MYEPEPIEPFVQHVASETWSVFTRDAVLYILASLIVSFGALFSLFILAGPLTVGFLQIVQRRQRGEPASVGDIFSGFDKFIPSFLLSILLMILMALGILCLVVPSLLVALFSIFAFPALAYEDAPAVDALKRSFQLVKDNLLNTVVLLLALSVLHAVGGALVFGFLFSAPLGLLAIVVAYQRIVMPRAQALGTPPPY